MRLGGCCHILGFKKIYGVRDLRDPKVTLKVTALAGRDAREWLTVGTVRYMYLKVISYQALRSQSPLLSFLSRRKY